jgi:hypothetical protein
MTRKMALSFLFSAAYAAMMAAASDGEAQNANANANASSGAQSNSQSSSGAAAIAGGGNQTTGITFNNTSPDNVRTTNTNNSNSTSSGSFNQTNSGYTTSDVIVRTTPTVYAPPVSGGNPCTLAVSGGVSVIGWGASAGGTFVDEACATRQKIAMIWNAGFKGAAKELMCNDRPTYDAFKTAGEPCAFRSQYEPAQVQAVGPRVVPVQVQAVPTPVQYLPPKEYPRCNAKRGIVDNCQS